ncbi:arylsulfatase [Parapedobacter indicus]|uniref:Arylsulfatase A n=1 Tax=Parapedobacter indicus TaxID=1477437 RepID=A0A1I3HRZ6_9SPHI|nr:arylsulfatase [Parapedobacter indicus]PPL03145.1 arylsulfatase A-like enzyme [Parapedobacter indicus]SFI38505.1 Arylsulfatase A [Parapedobacter indicus]
MRYYPILALLLINGFCASAQTANNASTPNIIYIYADDLGYGEIESYGQLKIKTPNLNRLREEGMKFTNHYTSMPVCAPARCMLLTGKNGGHSYIRGNYELGGFADSLEGGQMPLPEGTYTLPKMLKAAGYTTGMAGKWGLGMHDNTGSPLKQGFDFYVSVLDQKQAHNFYPTHLWLNDERLKLNNPEIDVHRKIDPDTAKDADFDYFVGNEYSGDVMTKHALEFIDKSKDRPFFLYLPFPQPHVSLQAPQAYIDEYIGKFNGEQPYYGEKGYAFSKYPLSTYAAMITYLDAQIGKVMDKVSELGLDDHTIIMFSSDNGTTFNGGVNADFFNSVDGLRGLKMDVFEGGIRVPFLARWPGQIKAGSTTDLVSVQYDLMATLAELTHQDPGNTNGLSFLPTLLGKDSQQKRHEYTYWEYPEKGGQIAVRMGKWKGVKINVRKSTYANTPWMIFDLESDRNETEDLANQHPDLVKRFDEIVQKEHQPAHIREWEFINPKF